MEGEASPENADEREESWASDVTWATQENDLKDDKTTPVKALDDAGASVEVVEDSPRNAFLGVSSAPSSRCSSPLASLRQAGHFRSNSFQRLRHQVQRALRWGSAGGATSCGNREQSLKATLNLEIMAKQKRLWYRTQSKVRDIKQHREPTSLFEQFFIVGLSSHTNVKVIEDAFSKRKACESEVAKFDILDLRKLQYNNGQTPTLEPQVLFKYPPVRKLAMRETDIPSFCFPEGVKARLVEKTPSMSDLNELVFGQEHLARDDLSSIFCLKVSDNSTLYGVCLHVHEIVQRIPSILGGVSLLNTTTCKTSRFLVAAPRCYCILTRVPFFELHFEMLNSIISQERLDRITQYISDMALIESAPQVIEEHQRIEANYDSLDGEYCNSWMGFAIPVESVSCLTSYSAVSISDRETTPILFRQPGSYSPEIASLSEVSDASHARELDKESRKSSQCLNDFTSENSGYRSDSFERVNCVFENGQTSPEVNFTAFPSISYRLERFGSLESVYSSARVVGSDDEDDFDSTLETSACDQKVMVWAKAHNNEALQIVCGYHALPVPPRGGEISFHPLEHLQPIKYCRPDASSLGIAVNYDIDPLVVAEVNELNFRVEAAEEAFALSIWTVSTVCRALSLDSVLALVTGALLEKQVVVTCPNLGILCAICLSVIPMIRPFEWQSLFLPILPIKMFDFLDAPVPFIVGILHKPSDVKLKASNVIRVNVLKDRVKMCALPQLPRYRELITELTPIHARLACENSIAKRHPVYKCSEVQTEAAGIFLTVMRSYMESLCSDLRSHTITNIQSNNDKVSLLLKDSFIDSFPIKDQPFIKLFVDTQLFSVLSDSQMSNFENEKL